MGDLVFWILRMVGIFMLIYRGFTLCGSYRNIGAKQAGAAGVARRNEKLRKYSEQMEMVAFEPLVVESIGGWNLEGKKLLKKIAAMESF
jgi:hypothetical protein